MEKTVAYLSHEWRDEVEKRLNAEITTDKMKRPHHICGLCVCRLPGRKRQVPLLQDRKRCVRPGPGGRWRAAQAEFRVTGPYILFADLSQGKVSSQRALMSGKLKLKGNMVKALKLASLADRINKVLAKIPTQY